MEKPRFFRKSNTSQIDPLTPKQPAQWGKRSKTFVFVILLAVVIGFLGWKGFVFAKQVSDNWQEVSFAISKPQFVKPVREAYQQRQTALDQEFKNGQKSDQVTLNAVKQAVDDEIQKQQPKPTAQSFR